MTRLVVAQALPQLLGDARHADRIPITDMPLDQLAELNDWSAEASVLTSPDLYCRLEHTPGEEIAWQVEHGYFEGAPLATFTQDALAASSATSSPTWPRPWRWSGPSPTSPSARGTETAP
ncbi:hypothetical protein [Streptomyces lydicus]|uniref:hypothetical protein n=1 Tax=Streptomyces lydicus TaxID=47763 RepID=UPI0019D6CDF5|nr:hypothetical protein [Streptomyces lydicus]MCZ1006019.1 hypothetical protein [Streptomyces lydicus]